MMATSTMVVSLPPPGQIAQAVAGIEPAELSKAPLLGILGVIIGAGTVTLTSRMISLGLADLRGHLGLGFDDTAWITAAFDMALIFIGPLTVFLGGLLGPRTILFLAATMFTVACAFLPLIHNYSLLIVAIVLAGLTSGTFYPLTLTFALRNIPLPYLPFTIGLYATFVDGAVNIAPSLYGWYRNHLSWHWMFWNSAVITPVMALCIYFGIPKSPAGRKPGPAPSFAGFLYAAAGLAMLLGACDEGERLDWWRSGVFTAMFAGGSFLLLCALVRRLRGANPFVDLPYLRHRNTVLLGIMLFMFRFTLVTTIILIPQSLAIHGFEADQIGPSVIWSAAPLLLIALIIGLLMLAKVDTRLIMASGFVMTAIACYLNVELTSAWSASNYYRTELLTGVGQLVAFGGLVGTIILQGIFSGGLMKPQRILTFSSYFHTIRIFGGTLGAIYMGHFVAQREKLHSNLLGLHLQRGSWITDSNIRGITAGVFSKSSGLPAATSRAIELIGARVSLQAYTLSIIDGFYLVAWACVVALLITASIRRLPLNYGDLSAVQQHLLASQEAKS
jgi:MFS transporter, DHA2 family, multidrug resistance protein